MCQDRNTKRPALREGHRLFHQDPDSKQIRTVLLDRRDPKVGRKEPDKYQKVSDSAVAKSWRQQAEKVVVEMGRR